MRRRTLFHMLLVAPLAKLLPLSGPETEVTYTLVRNPVREAEWTRHCAHLAAHAEEDISEAVEAP